MNESVCTDYLSLSMLHSNMFTKIQSRCGGVTGSRRR